MCFHALIIQRVIQKLCSHFGFWLAKRVELSQILLILFQMTLFVANRKAEKFRHMISGSLYNIIDNKTVNSISTNSDFPSESAYTIHSCEVFCGTSGYALALKDEKENSQQNGTTIKGTLLDCNYQDGQLLKGNL